jgi:hypothetical protein
MRQYENTKKSYDERFQEAERTYRKAQRANQALNIAIAVNAAIYVVNVVDAAWSVPNREQFKRSQGGPHGP